MGGSHSKSIKWKDLISIFDPLDFGFLNERFKANHKNGLLNGHCLYEAFAILPSSLRKALVTLFQNAKVIERTELFSPTNFPIHNVPYDQRVTDMDYFTLIRLILYGSNDEKAWVIFLWWNLSKLSFPDFIAKLVETLNTAYVVKSKHLFTTSPYRQDHINALTRYLLCRLKKGRSVSINSMTHQMGSESAETPTQDPSDFNVFSHFFYREPIFQKLTSILFLQCFYPASYPLDQYQKLVLKNLLNPTLETGEVQTHFLTPSLAFFLSEFLPSECRIQWKLVYCSSHHGNSFSTFLHKITGQGPSACKGKSIILLKDTDNHIFGAYSSESWKILPKYYGNSSSFLFQIQPDMCIFRSSGYNDHYQYLNNGMETLPNGLGIGGQLHYFGLWLDAKNFGTGSSKKCSSFESPILSGIEDFTFDELEVWVVQEEIDPYQVQEQGSILDGNQEAKAFLEMAGVKLHSTALRDPDLDKE